MSGRMLINQGGEWIEIPITNWSVSTSEAMEPEECNWPKTGSFDCQVTIQPDGWPEMPISLMPNSPVATVRYSGLPKSIQHAVWMINGMGLDATFYYGRIPIAIDWNR